MSVQITPAILTADPAKLREIAERYIAAGFTAIDIDVQEPPFVETPTVNFAQTLEVIKQINPAVSISWGWDLKVANPSQAIRELRNYMPAEGWRIFVYQGAEIDSDIDQVGLRLGLLPKDEIIKELSWYEVFPEIQIMSIDGTAQGSELDSELLEKIYALRRLGYQGNISIDGGVNLDSAIFLKEFFRNAEIQRVSVGSYFQKCETVEQLQAASRDLNHMLNS